MHNQSILFTCRCSQMPVRQNKEKNHYSRFHSDSQYRLLLFFSNSLVLILNFPLPSKSPMSLHPTFFELDYRKIMILLNFLIILFSHSSIRLWSFATSTFPTMQLICSPPPPPPPKKKKCIAFVFSFLLGITAVQREIENNAYAKFGGGGGGQIRCIMGNVKVAYDYYYEYRDLIDQ